MSVDEIDAIFEHVEETEEIKQLVAKDEVEIEAEETDLDVLLDSCGILATSPTHVLNTLVQTRKAKSLDMMHCLVGPHETSHVVEPQGGSTEEGISRKPKSPRMPLRFVKDNLVASSMTRSLDFEESTRLNRHTISESHHIKHKAGLPTFAEFVNQESNETTSSLSSDSGIGPKSQSEAESQREASQHIDSSEEKMETGSSHVSFSIESPTAEKSLPKFQSSSHKSENVPAKSSQTPLDTADGNSSSQPKEPTPSHIDNQSNQVNMNGAGLAGNLNAIAEDAERSEYEKNEENNYMQQTSNPPPAVQLFHPSMKMSLR